MKEQLLEQLVGKNIVISAARGTDEEMFISGVVEKILAAQDDDPPVILLKDRWEGVPVSQEVEITEL